MFGKVALLFFVFGFISAIKIPKLKSGDEVRIVAASGFLTAANRAQLTKSIEMLKSWNLKVTLGENIFKNSTSVGGFAGLDAQRISDFNKAIEDDNVKAIFCARGGYGSPRIVNQLNFEKLKKKPKYVIGYSDVTLILLHMEGHGIPGGIHGPMPASSGFTTPSNAGHIKSILFLHLSKKIYVDRHNSNRNGKAQGKIIVGNVSLMANSLGSIGEIQTDGKILFIEEIGESLYALDRYLQALKNAKKFDKLQGLVVGGMTNMRSDQYFGDVTEVINQLANSVSNKFPIGWNVKFGHIEDNQALMNGAEVTMYVNQQTGTLIEFH
eukprot:gene4607-7989_t